MRSRVHPSQATRAITGDDTAIATVAGFSIAVRRDQVANLCSPTGDKVQRKPVGELRLRRGQVRRKLKSTCGAPAGLRQKQATVTRGIGRAVGFSAFRAWADLIVQDCAKPARMNSIPRPPIAGDHLPLRVKPRKQSRCGLSYCLHLSCVAPAFHKQELTMGINHEGGTFGQERGFFSQGASHV